MKNENQQDEMARVLSNPSNLIVSDSLVGRLDFDEDPPPVEIKAEFSFCGEYVSGRFKNYKIITELPGEKVAVTFVTAEDQLEKLFNAKTSEKISVKILNQEIAGILAGISVSSQSSELVVTVTVIRNT